jgi:DNA processing protein
MSAEVTRRLSEEDAVCATALAMLGAGPRRLRSFLEGFSPSQAWIALAAAEHGADSERAYSKKAISSLLEHGAQVWAEAGAQVLVRGYYGYPDALRHDEEAPAILFGLGDPLCCDGRLRVAVVGTRSATPYGVGVATALGRGLAEAGVVVVSGLARGIDSAAHGGTVGVTGGLAYAVLGTAIDGCLPHAQEVLRGQVAERGAVLSELAPRSSGAPAWWFAVRNRVIAALSHLVVVVESHTEGGAMHTVRYARHRGIPVAAVPGSVRSAASAGANALLVEGASAVRDCADVLSLLAHVGGQPTDPRGVPARGSAAAPPLKAQTGRVRGVLEALDHDPVTLDTVALRCGLSLGETALGLEQLADEGLAECEGGWWCRRRS